MRLYQREPVVDSTSVTVGTGSVARDPVHVDPRAPAIFRIGELDGTPEGFLSPSSVHDAVRLDR